MVGGSSACRPITERIPNCVVFSPAGAKAASYICDNRRDAMRMAPQLQTPDFMGRDELGTRDSV
jgi:hypothetical protein